MYISIKNEGELLVARGSTFPVKEHLKKFGGVWNPSLHAWTLPLYLDPESTATSLNNILEAEVLKTKLLRAMAPTPESKRADVAEALARGNCHWICCLECEVIDWKRQHTNCRVHSVDGNTFRVRGNIYTGN